MDIDDRFIDVDFEAEPDYVFGDLGTGLYGDSYGIFEEKYGVLSDAEIDAAIEANEANGGGGARFVTRIYDQGQEGSCVANATCQAIEMVQALQYGREHVIPLSAISLYKRIGRSAQSGAMVSDGLEEAVKNGVLPLDTPENRQKFGEQVMPNTGFSRKYPDGWQETASGLVIVEYDIIRSSQGLKTALALLQPVVVGRQGHSITYADIIRRSGRYLYPYPNSWRITWGQAYANMEGGFGFDSQSQAQQSARWAFTVRSVRVPARGLAA